MANEDTRKIFDENLGDLKEDLWNAVFVYQTYRIWKASSVSAKFQIHLAVSLMLLYSVLGQNSTHCCKIILFLSKIREKKQSFKNIFY